jgi:hypothetical protein
VWAARVARPCLCRVRMRIGRVMPALELSSERAAALPNPFIGTAPRRPAASCGWGREGVPTVGRHPHTR